VYLWQPSATKDRVSSSIRMRSRRAVQCRARGGCNRSFQPEILPLLVASQYSSTSDLRRDRHTPPARASMVQGSGRAFNGNTRPARRPDPQATTVAPSPARLAQPEPCRSGVCSDSCWLMITAVASGEFAGALDSDPVGQPKIKPLEPSTCTPSATVAVLPCAASKPVVDVFPDWSAPRITRIKWRFRPSWPRE